MWEEKNTFLAVNLMSDFILKHFLVATQNSRFWRLTHCRWSERQICGQLCWYVLHIIYYHTASSYCHTIDSIWWRIPLCFQHYWMKSFTYVWWFIGYMWKLTGGFSGVLWVKVLTRVKSFLITITILYFNILWIPLMLNTAQSGLVKFRSLNSRWQTHTWMWGPLVRPSVVRLDVDWQNLLGQRSDWSVDCSCSCRCPSYFWI